MTLILGISAYSPNAATCLTSEGRIIAAAREEWFTQKLSNSLFPSNAALYCLRQASAAAADLTYVVYAEKPLLAAERFFEAHMAAVPRGLAGFIRSLPNSLKLSLMPRGDIVSALGKHLDDEIDWSERVLFVGRHLSHVASAFYPSPFEKAAILTGDGLEDWITTSISIGDGNQLTLENEIRFPHSLKLLYSAFSDYTGARYGADTVSGLAALGEPKYVALIKEHLIDIKADGSFRLNLEYFGEYAGNAGSNRKWEHIFGRPALSPGDEISRLECDLASSFQMIVEEVTIRLARHAADKTGLADLCLAGDITLNGPANGRLMKENIFRRVWIQPAVADVAAALGAALTVYHTTLGQPRRASANTDQMSGTHLGPGFAQEDVTERLRECGAKFSIHTDQEIVELTARALADGKFVGWHRGRAEIGSQPLGGRSVLAAPRITRRPADPTTKEAEPQLRLVIMAEDAEQWFGTKLESPYMQVASSLVMAIPAPETQQPPEASLSQETDLFSHPKLDAFKVGHCARLQTVRPDTAPQLYDILRRFKELTGCPTLSITPFRAGLESIALTPEDAFACFMRAECSKLVVGNCFLSNTESPRHDRTRVGDMRPVRDRYPFLAENLTFSEETALSIVSLTIEHATTKALAEFYATAPFPHYNEFDTAEGLARTLDRNAFLSNLKRHIGLGKRVVEVGSGTCQLSIALASSTNNEVVALDPTRESLVLGAQFCRKCRVDNVAFVNADIFANPFTRDYFDAVICNGVLHHTENPRLAFETITLWLKPGGLLVIGLYNRYGRFLTFLRRLVYRCLRRSSLGERIVYFMDPRLRQEISREKKHAWFRDQYCNPRESSHTLDETLKWFSANSIEYIGSIPSCTGAEFTGFDRMATDTGTWADRIISQISMIWGRAGTEGGVFIVMGRKVGNPTDGLHN